MAKIVVENKIDNFNKVIYVDGDKSLSIRSLLIGSQSYGICKINNLPKSEDIMSTIAGLQKLGVKISLQGNTCSVYGKGLNSFNFKKYICINAGNSGTFARLLLGLLIKTPNFIKITGDKSLSQRDFQRVITPLSEFGASFYNNNRAKLPLKILGSEYIKPINYFEKRGSAQCKSSVMFAALNSPGTTIIKAKKSRDHTEIFFKYLKLPINIIRNKNFDIIKIKGEVQFKSFNYDIPGDISSSAFFIIMTLLSTNSKLKIKNVNLNPSRIGFINIANKMGAKIKILNKKNRYGEIIGDIFVKSQSKLKAINCPSSMNSNAIDEFLIIFLIAAKAYGVSNFKNLGELNKKESPRLKLGSKILNKMGIKTVQKKNSIKIFGNPKLSIQKDIVIKNFYKDHRIFMTSVIAALCFGGKWVIHDVDSHKSSFPSFMNLLKKIGSKYTLI
tara:strand:+ start:757 stop:2088 length:1332 start_codon:yes stop_codon:yes gene_type:complete